MARVGQARQGACLGARMGQCELQREKFIQPQAQAGGRGGEELGIIGWVVRAGEGARVCALRRGASAESVWV